MIPFSRPTILGTEAELINKCIESGALVGGESFSSKCEKWFEETLGTKKAFLTPSCTSALEMAVLLADIKDGDEVIMPSYTFVSTANAVVLRGGVPVFVDIRRDNMNIDEEKIEEAITDRTRAILPVHYAGYPASMSRIMAIAKKHNIVVIEDAAQALLSKSDDGYMGCVGDMGCMSFHATKNINCGEGGVLLINDQDLYARSEIIRFNGTDRSQFLRKEVDKYVWQDLGSSFLLSGLTSAFLYAQLLQAAEVNKMRLACCSYYYELLAPLVEAGHITIPGHLADEGGNGHIFYIETKSEAERRKLIAHLRAKDIYAVSHYVPLHSSPAGVKMSRTAGSMSVTDDLSVRILRLPMFHGLQRHQIETVVREISEFYNG